MDKVDKKYSVAVTSEGNIPEIKVFSDYKRARAYFLELIGNYFLTTLIKNGESADNLSGIKGNGLGELLLCNKVTYFESNIGSIHTLPLDAEEFSKNYGNWATINIGYCQYTIQIVEEVS